MFGLGFIKKRDELIEELNEDVKYWRSKYYKMLDNNIKLLNKFTTKNRKVKATWTDKSGKERIMTFKHLSAATKFLKSPRTTIARKLKEGNGKCVVNGISFELI